MAHINKDDLVQSYHRVRTALGILGMALPVFLIVAGLSDTRIEPSISDFYHTIYRDIFVGTMIAIGVFLFTYRGYRRTRGEWLDDDWLATIAGVAAIGLAMFPNESPTQQVATMTQRLVGMDLSPPLHYASALIFFACLAAFCLVKFARTAKPARRWIYRSCGWVIVGSLIAIFVASAFKIMGGPTGKAFVVEYNLVFWFEAVGIWAFGLSWLVKGKADLMVATRVAALRRIARPETKVTGPPPAE